MSSSGDTIRELRLLFSHFPMRRAVVILAMAAIAAPGTRAGEFHMGMQLVCSDCHTLHASERGQVFAAVEHLLKSTSEVALCLSCHDGSDPRAPDIVAGGTASNPSESVSTGYASRYGSSAGFFQADYAAEPNPAAHDLFSVGNVIAPLSSSYSRQGGLRCSTCHDVHGNGNFRNLLPDPNPAHGGSVQIEIGAQVTESIPVNVQNPTPALSYDTGNIGFYVQNNFAAWCADCHDLLAGNTLGSLPAHFRRHPSDVGIGSPQWIHSAADNWIAGQMGQSTGFGALVGDGTPGIPRLRFGSPTGSGSLAESGDTVFCLTCHKAHGSKYRGALVWPHGLQGSDSISGCQQCHSNGDAYGQTKHGSSISGVIRDPSRPRGDCSQCHIIHGDSSAAHDFLLFSDNYGAQRNGACTAAGCHAGGGAGSYQGPDAYLVSAHGQSPRAYWPGPRPPARPASDNGNCANCHDPHGVMDTSGLIPSLAVLREEGLCMACHDGRQATSDIARQISKVWGHSIADPTLAGRHRADEAVLPGSFGADRRHVECADCHNVHALTDAGTHAVGTNEASEMLKRVSRVEVSYGAASAVPPTFTPRAADYTSEVRYEYEICFKCHSYWAYGNNPPASTAGGLQTDPSVEFNPRNKSYHPVVDVHPTPNPFAYRNLDTTQGYAWNTAGPNRMYCSDCHRSELTTDPAGPHGSTNKYILAAPSSGTIDDLCYKCHRQDVYRDGFSSGGIGSGFREHKKHVRDKNTHCRDCHGGSGLGAVHGSDTYPRLIGGSKIQSFTPAPGVGQQGFCDPTCHGNKSYRLGSGGG